MTSTQTTLTGERADLVQTLDKHRGFFRYTVRDLTDEQATTRTTASALTLAGLIKHVAHTEQKWADFAQRGAQAFDTSNWGVEAWQAEWSLQPGETLASVLAEYEEIAARTDELVATLDLDAGYALPQAPWFEPGAVWSVRRTVLHIIAETAQHAGHADILRESLDGQKTMG
ncbi:DinB family protein [Petropleomorpha daqingensis]|uniref:Putative damage-inducible protein DinB n=1 Tax=Petropleomorpha daqingensis TaxID=2026353 RepID=A0A853C846_9ACTN|nr:DinB family protein [Petropleomorpha daqingensis]NYJ04055.1 putative damage-inducible protein DinB [Petropleomorpha daqingensis]